MDNFFPALVYLLCLATSATCAVMLGRSFLKSRSSLLFWSSLSFALIAVNNFFVVVDLVFIPSVDLRLPRLLLSLAAVSVLLFGFIWNSAEER